ncbi:TRAP transporter small permease subunit [Thaumasiovibrio subtropicus]|uniref:TRAP transporter small permease subunit n=1 Tax=Thaumasiovibrio subtropicus TaxID=1891207 RepID=UPI000B361100|nr:TRAP transporter small permease subunit [Thaumasiovibrio subtropicus]
MSKSHSLFIADAIDTLIRRAGQLFSLGYLLLIGVIILQVVLRKGFANGLIALEELQWHLYAVGVMFGVSYAQITNTHVRVDLFYHRFSDKTKSIVEIFGILFFMLPFMFVVFYHSLEFVYEAWRVNESSDSPSGLPWRWLVKSVIPASFFLLMLATLSRLIREVAALQGKKSTMSNIIDVSS